jgi:hypothetical protein
MLAAEWRLIDESYGWLALGFSTTWTTKTAQTGDELCRFRRYPERVRGHNTHSGSS